MPSPYKWPESYLTEGDLIPYNSVFSDAVRDRLPCNQVDIVSSGISKEFFKTLPDGWEEGLELVWEKGKPVVDNDIPRLFLPLWAGEKPYATVIITGGDESLYQRHSIKSLLEFSKCISKDFHEIKINGTDPLTGLLNSVLFRRGLSRLSEKAELATLVLLEVYPRHKDASQGLSYLKRVGGSLRSMAGSTVPVYHLGGGTFAMFWRGADAGKAGDMADVVLHRFQLDGISRCHIGMIQIEKYPSAGAEQLFDLAWEAVVKARQRGPFARFTYCTKAELEKHPFRPLPVKTVNRFKSLWRGEDSFGVAALSVENGTDLAALEDYLSGTSEAGLSMVGSHAGTVFIFYKGCSGKECLAQVRQLSEKIKHEIGIEIFAGVAEYPCQDHKRSEVPVNSRKALYHSFYLGSGSSVLLNAVSFNISGDVYYNEGDINLALRDYHFGLDFDSENINLLNSIGVAYASLGVIKKGVEYFERALNINDSDYMALYNLGSAWLTDGRDDLAAGYLERAHKRQSDNFDLTLQLAGVYCRTGEYREVVNLLEKKADNSVRGRGDWETGAAFRCLGEAWRELGENHKAIKALQKASVCNPRDARVLSMLGELYDIEGQGDGIALDLCVQALELDESLWDNWYRLGAVKYRQGRHGSAIADLQKSLRLNRHNPHALRILAAIYDKIGKTRLAGEMLAKEQKLLNNTCNN